MSDALITVYSHHFSATNLSVKGREFVMSQLRKNVQYKLVKEQGQWKRIPFKVFGAANRPRTVFRLHINQLNSFRTEAQYAGVELTEVAVPFKEIPEIDLPIKDMWVDRVHQPPIIDYIVRPEGPTCRFVELQTGKGKSYCAMKAGSKLKCRSAYIFKPGYIGKWIIDIKKTYDIPEKEILSIQGSKHLKALLELARDGELKARVILISNTTFRNWLSLYEEIGDKILEEGYACRPEEFFEFCGIGYRVIDEVHQDYHFNFKLDLYTHCRRTVSLSATFFVDDPFVSNMYTLGYPIEDRYESDVNDKYIDTRTQFYQFNNPRKYATTERGSNAYSHNAFERSLMKDKTAFRNFIEMHLRLIDHYYIDRKQEDDKMVIFFASIDMCTEVAGMLEARYHRYDVRRYVGSMNDPYENLMEPDIRITTHGSAGTAIDIPGLTLTLQTVSMRSSPAVIQNLGRLRVLPDGRSPLYLKTVCQDIPKQMEYHEHFTKLMADRARSQTTQYHGALI